MAASSSLLTWLSTSGIGVGIFLLAYTLLSFLVEAAWGLLTRRRKGILRILPVKPEAEPVKKVSNDELLGLANVPWVQIYLAGAVVALVLYLLTHQILALLLALVPFGVRAWLTAQRKRQIGYETLSFLTDLRLAIPLQGSLLRALQEVAAHSETSLARITARYLRGGWSGGGLDLLERLAQETRLPYLADLVAWSKAAQEGTLAADTPFEHALARLQSETYTTTREYMQQIPTRLTILVLPALLGPAIVLLLYPIVARLLASLGNMGWGGGF